MGGIMGSRPPSYGMYPDYVPDETIPRNRNNVFDRFFQGLGKIGSGLANNPLSELNNLANTTMIGQILTAPYRMAKGVAGAATGEYSPFYTDEFGRSQVHPRAYQTGMDAIDTLVFGGMPSIARSVAKGSALHSPNVVRTGLGRAGRGASRGPAKAAAAGIGRKDIPGLMDRSDWAIMTAENPGGKVASAADNLAANRRLIAELDKRGIKYQPITGKYSNDLENSFYINVDHKTAQELGRMFGQESVLTRRGLEYGDGTINPSTGLTLHDVEPEMYYSTIMTPDGPVHFTVDIDFDRKLRFMDRPDAGPPVLRNREGRDISDGPVENWRDIAPGPDEHYAKHLTDDERALVKVIDDAKAAMKAEGYDPYFDPSKRYDADFSKYPEASETPTRDLLHAAKPETRAKYEALATEPGVKKRLRRAYNASEGDVLNWYAMGQLEEMFIDEFGEDLGRQLFRERFSIPMAATTSGATPENNFRLAMYANERARKGLPAAPEVSPHTGKAPSHQMPVKVGGSRYSPAAGLEKYDLWREQGFKIDPKKNPKPYNFNRNYLGDRQSSTMDEQISEVMTGGGWEGGGSRSKAKPFDSRDYGPFEVELGKEAKRLGLDPSDFQSSVWFGHKRMKGDPFINTVNEAIERTSRVTGQTPDEVVREGILYNRSPIYANNPKGAAAESVIMHAGRDNVPQGPSKLRGYHGSPHNYAAERLVRHADGREEYIVGLPDMLPDVPPGATVIEDYPLGRMRIDKIGTGEGAQAFGHGLYAAGNEPVGRYYFENLAKDTDMTIGGKSVRDYFGGDLYKAGVASDHLSYLNRRMSNSGNSAQHIWKSEVLPQIKRKYMDAKDDVDDVMGSAIDAGVPWDEATETLAENERVLREVYDWARDFDASEVGIKSGGRMYEVVMDVDPVREMLDYDKPISSQPHVEAIIKDIARQRLKQSANEVRAAEKARADAGQELLGYFNRKYPGDHAKAQDEFVAHLSGNPYEQGNSKELSRLMEAFQKADREHGWVQRTAKGIDYEHSRFKHIKKFPEEKKRLEEINQRRIEMDDDVAKYYAKRDTLEDKYGVYSSGGIKPELVKEYQEKRALLDIAYEGVLKEYNDLGKEAGRIEQKIRGRHTPKGMDYAKGNRNLGINAEEMAEELKRRGLKGIRYFDAQSRGLGEGKHNYVLFDDKFIRVIRKYFSGEPTAMAAISVFQRLPEQQQSNMIAASEMSGKPIDQMFDFEALGGLLEKSPTARQPKNIPYPPWANDKFKRHYEAGAGA